MTKLTHTDIRSRFAGGVTSLGAVGPKASGLADTLASLVSAPVRGADHALSSPNQSISSIIHEPSPTGMT